MFRQIKGQDHAIQILKTAIEHDRVSHAYLFHGPEGVGKFITAFYFGMALNCLSKTEFRPCGVCASCRKLLNFDHPDFIYLFPTPNLQMSPDGEIKDKEALAGYEGYIKNKKESPWQQFRFNKGTEIRKESVMMLIRRLDLSIFEANYRVCIIEDADTMNIQTANAFLKTLEEPPRNTVMILTTSRLSNLLPTIVSRCQPVYFKPLTRGVTESLLRERFDYDLPTARSAARVSGGNFETAVRVAEGSAMGLRDLAFKMMALALEDKELEYLQLLDSIKEATNAESIRHLIAYLGFIANDLAVLRSNPDEITNIDRIEELQTLAREDEDLADDVLDYLKITEDFRRKIDGNVNLRLILLNNYYALRDLTRGS